MPIIFESTQQAKEFAEKSGYVQKAQETNCIIMRGKYSTIVIVEHPGIKAIPCTLTAYQKTQTPQHCHVGRTYEPSTAGRADSGDLPCSQE